MTISRQEIEDRVSAVVAEALDQPKEKVTRHASLIDDLQAESIDFLDIVFRLESVFGIRIPSEEVWKGAFLRGDDSGGFERNLDALKERLPEFRWDRFRGGITRAELPRLITVNTIVDYLEGRLGAGEA